MERCNFLKTFAKTSLNEPIIDDRLVKMVGGCALGNDHAPDTA